ncbi:UNVERIFIED_CONTAM: hypothetical protein GTU68_064301 [Idotea baltica]|nr:hypothetical protein [Idotea baltica]
MNRALKLAKKGMLLGEVPVGAVVVKNNKVIGEGFNSPITTHDPSAHAEIMAIRMAALHENNYRLSDDSTLYVTLEPCSMCAGLIVHARINRVIFAAYEPKSGVVESQNRFFAQPFLNHKVQTAGGLLAEESAALLRQFFKLRRLNKSNHKIE